MKSNFNVKCPYCHTEHNLFEDGWNDELLDDTGTTVIECSSCEYPMEIVTDAVYTLEVEPYDEYASEFHCGN